VSHDRAIGWASHGWWTGGVDYMLEGAHNKPFGVWIGDDVQPVKRAGVSLSISGDQYPVLAIHRKTAGVCWRITCVIYFYWWIKCEPMLGGPMCYHFILKNLASTAIQ
jgi:hypothetical protein